MSLTKAFWQFGNLYRGEELVMGLPNELAFAQGMFQGCLLSEDHACDLEVMLEGHAEWRARNEVEEINDWQQIFPYGIFRYQDQYMEVKRGTEVSHRRFSQKYTLGVGGHVVKQEFDKFGSLSEWMRQMFLHDFVYEGNITSHCIGIVNDKSEDLGRNHVALVYLLEGDTPEFQKKKQAEARLVRLQDLTGEDVSYLERWSQMIYRQLKELEMTG